MISTVTTSTVSTVSTAALAGSIALVGILVLLVLLIQKEITTAAADSRLRRLGVFLNIGIVPLLFAFVVTTLSRIAEVLR